MAAQLGLTCQTCAAEVLGATRSPASVAAAAALLRAFPLLLLPLPSLLLLHLLRLLLQTGLMGWRRSSSRSSTRAGWGAGCCHRCEELEFELWLRQPHIWCFSNAPEASAADTGCRLAAALWMRPSAPASRNHWSTARAAPELPCVCVRFAQEKSYFALRLPAGWWVFGLDLALVGDIDMCQYR